MHERQTPETLNAGFPRNASSALVIATQLSRGTKPRPP